MTSFRFRLLFIVSIDAVIS